MPTTPRPLETAIRLASYRPFEDLAAAHVAACGVRLVEFHLPRDDGEQAARLDALQRHGLVATSLQGRLDLANPDVPAQFRPQLGRMQAFDCTRMLLAFPPPTLPVDETCRRLRAAAELAADHGVTLMLETHPDLFHNTAVARATLARIDHPSARVNFDPANILFYNESPPDPVEDLRTLGQAVAGIHMKDTPGGFGVRHFAELGSGVVDFPRVYQTLETIGYDGPCTIEIEGIADEDRTPDLVRARIERSLEHLATIGRR